MLDEIKLKIRDLVFRGEAKVPAADLERRIAGVAKGLVKRAVKELVGQGELQYTYVHGTSFLEPSFDRPVHVCKRIVLKPPDKAYEPKCGEAVVILAGGAAFGNGAHPTTCLALQVLDESLGERSTFLPNGGLTGLDVGTGTGVLAIAMARLGVQKVVGTDIDPCAISEASKNVLRNRLSNHVTVLDIPVEKLGETYDVVMANLAYPTLKRMASVLSVKTRGNGLLVLSGFKTSASKDLTGAFVGQGFTPVQERSDRGWVCLAFRKRPIP